MLARTALSRAQRPLLASTRKAESVYVGVMENHKQKIHRDGFILLRVVPRWKTKRLFAIVAILVTIQFFMANIDFRSIQ